MSEIVNEESMQDELKALNETADEVAKDVHNLTATKLVTEKEVDARLKRAEVGYFIFL
jgi:hypothetical protein